jgi:anti-anti-sigma factor
MDIASRRYGDVVVAAPAGRIDHANAESLTAALAPLLESAAGASPSLLLDFSRVDYISSVGLRVLMMAAKTLRAQQRKLGVAAPQPLVREIFEISRFNLILDLSPSVRAGLERLSPNAVAAFDAAEPAGAA